MGAFFNITPASKVVTLAGVGQHSVRNVSLRRIAALLIRFPALGNVVASKEFDLIQVIIEIPGAAAAVIACGLGKPDDADLEMEIDDDLTIDNQALLLEAIVEVTMPNGFRPLFERLRVLRARLGIDVSAEETAEPTTVEPAAGNGYRIRSTRSPLPSMSSEAAATP